LSIVGGVLLWLIIKWLFISPSERKFDAFVTECFSKQALKRNGTVTHDRQARLKVPYKTATIELSFLSDDDELYREHTYARFQTDLFTDKKFWVLQKEDSLLLRPLLVGTKIEVADEKFSEKFLVTGDDPTFVNRLLSQEVRERLLTKPLQIKFGGRSDSTLLSRERGWLSVFTPGATASDELFDDLIETAILFYERLESLSKDTSS